MICVCVPFALEKNEVYITLIVQSSPFLFKGIFLLDLLATSFFEASNHQPMTINQIQEKRRFDMEYMPTQTKNLTENKGFIYLVKLGSLLYSHKYTKELD